MKISKLFAQILFRITSDIRSTFSNYWIRKQDCKSKNIFFNLLRFYKTTFNENIFVSFVHIEVSNHKKNVFVCRILNPNKFYTELKKNVIRLVYSIREDLVFIALRLNTYICNASMYTYGEINVWMYNIIIKSLVKYMGHTHNECIYT